MYHRGYVRSQSVEAASSSESLGDVPDVVAEGFQRSSEIHSHDGHFQFPSFGRSFTELLREGPHHATPRCILYHAGVAFVGHVLHELRLYTESLLQKTKEEPRAIERNTEKRPMVYENTMEGEVSVQRAKKHPVGDEIETFRGGTPEDQ